MCRRLLYFLFITSFPGPKRITVFFVCSTPWYDGYGVIWNKKWYSSTGKESKWLIWVWVNDEKSFLTFSQFTSHGPWNHKWKFMLFNENKSCCNELEHIIGDSAISSKLLPINVFLFFSRDDAMI